MKTYIFNYSSYTRQGIEDLIENTSAFIRLLSDAYITETSAQECDRILKLINTEIDNLTKLQDLLDN